MALIGRKADNDSFVADYGFSSAKERLDWWDSEEGKKAQNDDFFLRFEDGNPGYGLSIAQADASFLQNSASKIDKLVESKATDKEIEKAVLRTETAVEIVRTEQKFISPSEGVISDFSKALISVQKSVDAFNQKAEKKITIENLDKACLENADKINSDDSEPAHDLDDEIDYQEGRAESQDETPDSSVDLEKMTSEDAGAAETGGKSPEKENQSFFDEYKKIKLDDVDEKIKMRNEYLSSLSNEEKHFSAVNGNQMIIIDLEAFNALANEAEKDGLEGKNVEKVEKALSMVEEDFSLTADKMSTTIDRLNSETALFDIKGFSNELKKVQGDEKLVEECSKLSEAIENFFQERSQEKNDEAADKSEQSPEAKTNESNSDEKDDIQDEVSRSHERKDEFTFMTQTDYSGDGSYLKDPKSLGNRLGELGKDSMVVFDLSLFRFRVVNKIYDSDKNKLFIKETEHSPIEEFDDSIYTDVTDFFAADKMVHEGFSKCLKGALKELNCDIAEKGNGYVLKIVDDDLERFKGLAANNTECLSDVLRSGFAICSMDGLYREMYASQRPVNKSDDSISLPDENRKEYDSIFLSGNTFGEIGQKNFVTKGYIEAFALNDMIASEVAGILETAKSERKYSKESFFSLESFFCSTIKEAMFKKDLINAGASKKEASRIAFALSYAEFPYGFFSPTGLLLNEKEEKFRLMVDDLEKSICRTIKTKNEYEKAYGPFEEVMATIEAAQNAMEEKENEIKSDEQKISELNGKLTSDITPEEEERIKNEKKSLEEKIKQDTEAKGNSVKIERRTNSFDNDKPFETRIFANDKENKAETKTEKAIASVEKKQAEPCKDKKVVEVVKEAVEKADLLSDSYVELKKDEKDEKNEKIVIRRGDISMEISMRQNKDGNYSEAFISLIELNGLIKEDRAVSVELSLSFNKDKETEFISKCSKFVSGPEAKGSEALEFVKSFIKELSSSESGKVCEVSIKDQETEPDKVIEKASLSKEDDEGAEIGSDDINALEDVSEILKIGSLTKTLNMFGIEIENVDNQDKAER
jgi:hypothetical protein